MAASITTLFTGNSSGSGPYTTDSMTIAADEIAVIAVWCYQGGTTIAPMTITDWEELGTSTTIIDAVGDFPPVGMYLFRRVGAFSGTQSISSGGSNLGYVVWQAAKISGLDTTTPERGTPAQATVTTDTSVTATFATTPLSSNAILAIAGQYDPGGFFTVETLTVRAGFTEVFNDPNASVGSCLMEFKSTGGDTAVSTTASGTTALGITGIEFNVLAASYVPADHFGMSGMFGS